MGGSPPSERTDTPSPDRDGQGPAPGPAAPDQRGPVATAAGAAQTSLLPGLGSGGEIRAEPGEAVLTATLERIAFENPDSHWRVVKLRLDEDAGADGAIGETVTAVGTLVEIREGTPLRLCGAWETHPKFGRQFKVRAYQPCTPETLTGLERYLGSGVIPGIGPELAKRIVARFGLKTLDIVEKEPRRLAEVDGIGATRVEKIAEAWKAQSETHEVMVFLSSYGVSAGYAARIHKRYGRDAIRVVRENPYRLALDIWGIGFKTADDIARNLGIERTAPARLEAGLVHVLGKLAEDGHVHVPEAHLVKTAAEILAVEPGLLASALENLEGSHLIEREALGDRGTCVSLTAMWEHENDAAVRFAELVSTALRPLDVDLPRAISAFEVDAGLRLAPQQRQAIEAAIMDKCVVITGGPGVGKTTIVRAIAHLFQALGRTLALAAPTGRAAKRLAESTGLDAVTLHRLLEFQPADEGFARGPYHPLEHEVVVVDEVSMVDLALFRALLAALSPKAQLVLVGDIDQLPSVGPGAVLSDVIASGAATVVRLDEVFRQSEASSIVVAAHQINRGMVPELDPPPGKDARRTDFYFIRRDDPAHARDTIVELVADKIPHAFGYDPVTDIQVLCPMHRGVLGTIALNQALQNRLNPPPPERPDAPPTEIRRGERAFRVGDKVMQLRNDYERLVFNGDIGVVCQVVADKRRLAVDFLDGRVAVYEPGDLEQLTHAYAVSVHKSQGSEYPVVIAPLVTQHYMMLQRNLLYTAVTRGKELVILIGSPRAVAMATHNHTPNQRWTWLAERIRRELGH
ncbi:SF1B family DNA helicase RecD2 [Haliangium sp.]|uniref:SF1B family DNA helicase RecD2 n=1 Tax=Haliangium sp. TaxID=2663208 RepID=UPI003D0ACB6D